MPSVNASFSRVDRDRRSGFRYQYIADASDIERVLHAALGSPSSPSAESPSIEHHVLQSSEHFLDQRRRFRLQPLRWTSAVRAAFDSADPSRHSHAILRDRSSASAVAETHQTVLLFAPHRRLLERIPLATRDQRSSAQSSKVQPIHQRNAHYVAHARRSGPNHGVVLRPILASMARCRRILRGVAHQEASDALHASQLAR